MPSPILIDCCSVVGLLTRSWSEWWQVCLFVCRCIVQDRLFNAASLLLNVHSTVGLFSGLCPLRTLARFNLHPSPLVSKCITLIMCNSPSFIWFALYFGRKVDILCKRSRTQHDEKPYCGTQTSGPIKARLSTSLGKTPEHFLSGPFVSASRPLLECLAHSAPQNATIDSLPR